MMRIVSLLSLLWSLVEVHSKSFPYVSFMGQTLANNSYVDISLVGKPDFDDGSEGVQCITDFAICCASADGPHRGDWYFPSGTRLPFTAFGIDTFEVRLSRGVDLRRNTDANSPTGIYRCDIPTLAVHHATNISTRDTVYVGLYTASGGDISISGGVTFDPHQLTLTCISTDGPATTVTWTRDNVIITGEQNETVLNYPVTARYTHTLTLTTAGEYTCTVANNKPSSASASTIIAGPPSPTDVTAVQGGPTSITVAWTPPDPLDGVTGYTISYTGGGSSGSETVSGGDTNSYTLTGLTNGQTYTISIVATSNGLSGPPVQVTVGLVPSAPVLDSTPTVTTDTITISGSVPSGSVVTSYVVQWQRDTSLVCPDLRDDGSITVASSSFTGHTITGLEPGNRYTITVTVSNGAGSGPVSDAVTAMTTVTAPTGLPGPITLVTVTPNSATVQWGEVPCLQRNGEIMDYTVTATNSDGMEEGTASVDVDAKEATISGLTAYTQYTVSVAAVNSAGTAPPTTLSVETPGSPSPTDVTAVQDGPTSITVTWTPPSPLGDTTGYRISFTGGSDVDIDGGSTNSYTLTGLTNGQTYTISIVATSEYLVSDATSFEIILIPAPGQVFVSVSSITATSISLSWSVSSGRVASWEVVWRPTDRGTESTSGPLSGTTYTIHQLDPSTIYTLTVSATNVAGTTDSTPILFSTGACNDIQARSSLSESESGATIGGVVGAVLIIAAATLILHVAIALLLRRQRGNYSTSAKRRHA